MLGQASLRFRRVAMRVFNRTGTPQRVARGLAAGFFAAALPIPGVRILLSLLLATLIRGSKIYALISQALLAWLFFGPLTRFECWLGERVWNGRLPAGATAFQCAQRVAADWDWRSPLESLRHTLDIYLSEPAAIGPLTLGVLYTGMLGAAIAYPIGAIISSEYYAYRLRRRARRGMRIMPLRGLLSVPEVSTPYDEQAALERYVLNPKRSIRADAAALLFDGRQGYPEMLRAIDAARQSVDLETYILRDDNTGRRFAAALSAAARRGVRTRLLFDAVGALGLPDAYVNNLASAGVNVAIFRPLSSIWRSGIMPFNRRDHRKIMVVDQRIGFIGGLNICDDNAPKEDGGMGWRDTHLRIDGAAVGAAMLKLFEETWALADGLNGRTEVKGLRTEVTETATEQSGGLSPQSFDLSPSVKSVLVQVLGNKEFLQRVRLRRAYVRAIRKAQHFILIENAYFIPDRGIRRALYRAVKRGVVVAAVVAMYSDVKVAALASRSLYSELIAGGVKLYEYPISMMHSKVAVVDDVWSMVGSYNLDHRSLMHNLEAGVMAVDPRLAHALRERIILDIEHSREITKDFHEARPWDHVLMEALAYQVRYWL